MRSCIHFDLYIQSLNLLNTQLQLFVLLFVDIIYLFDKNVLHQQIAPAVAVTVVVCRICFE